MSAILAALESLNEKITGLEARTAEREVAARTEKRQRRSTQEDLFTAQVASGVAARDNALLGQKLDGAIETLEKLLANG